MSIKSLMSCDRDSLENMKKYQLPNYFKKVGLILAVVSILSLFVNKWTADDALYKEIVKYGILCGLLLISISRDEIEDEFIRTLRMQSFAFAFIVAVVFSLVQPLINYLTDYFFDPGNAVWEETGDFGILWMLLFVQICFFELLKWRSK